MPLLFSWCIISSSCQRHIPEMSYAIIVLPFSICDIFENSGTVYYKNVFRDSVMTSFSYSAQLLLLHEWINKVKFYQHLQVVTISSMF